VAIKQFTGLIHRPTL